MGIKFKTTKNKIPDMIKTANSLNGRKVSVGVLKGDLSWLASIHEYGCNITARKAEYLTVPINPKAKGKRARDFDNTFVYTSNSGEKFIAQKTGTNSIELLFWLTKTVKIPERSFLRSGHDKNIDKILAKADKLLLSVLDGKLTEDDFLEQVGLSLATAIKTYARDLSTPPNSSITSGVKGSSNPLIDTGNLIEGISFEVE